MVKSNPWMLFDRFWKHCGGRMVDGRNSLNFDPRLDSPYIRAAEKVPMVRPLLAFMDRVESYESGTVRECELLLHRGSYAHWTASGKIEPVNLKTSPASGRPAAS